MMVEVRIYSEDLFTTFLAVGVINCNDDFWKLGDGYQQIEEYTFKPLFLPGTDTQKLM